MFAFEQFFNWFLVFTQGIEMGTYKRNLVKVITV